MHESRWLPEMVAGTKTEWRPCHAAANLSGQSLASSEPEIISAGVLRLERHLRLWSRATMKSLAVPGGVLLLAVALLTHSGWLTLAPPALSFLYYCALIGGMLLAWRFHSSRTFFALVVLFLAEQAMALSGSAMPSSPGWTASRAVSILVPLNFVLIALMQERGFTVSSIAPVGLFLFV